MLKPSGGMLGKIFGRLADKKAARISTASARTEALPRKEKKPGFFSTLRNKPRSFDASPKVLSRPVSSNRKFGMSRANKVEKDY